MCLLINYIAVLSYCFDVRAIFLQLLFTGPISTIDIGWCNVGYCRITCYYSSLLWCKFSIGLHPLQLANDAHPISCCLSPLLKTNVTSLPDCVPLILYSCLSTLATKNYIRSFYLRRIDFKLKMIESDMHWWWSNVIGVVVVAGYPIATSTFWCTAPQSTWVPVVKA